MLRQRSAEICDEVYWPGSWEGDCKQGPRSESHPTGGGCSPGDAVILPGRGAESCQAVRGKGRPILEGGGWSPGHAVILPGPGTESCQAVHGSGCCILEGGGSSPSHAKILPGPGAVFIPRVNIAGSGVDKERYEPVALSRPGSIREVWASNLEEEFRAMRQTVQQYNYVAMDTEFPGIVTHPIGFFSSAADYQYQLVRSNVNSFDIIQLGLTFFDEAGNPAPDCCTWQFNFKFNLNADMHAEDSILLLVNSGIQFAKHRAEGIEPNEFAQLFTISGIVYSENVRWLTFHSGYDFGYMIKLLLDQNLPENVGEFFELLRIIFPKIYDLKFLMRGCKSFRGGLQELANQLHVERVGQHHQAGSDSLLTAGAFFKMRQVFFSDQIDDAKYCGQIYGLGPEFDSTGSFRTTKKDPLPPPMIRKVLF
ncbi:CCR4-NOT transcription complex subunit 7 [Rhipicephalus microplus]|uniref:CCR4-NOT transcription complex subunit 7 n=1 Tax=Rhipicephalus microplus TaxID=6941 RepID=UPI003F6D7FFE